MARATTTGKTGRKAGPQAAKPQARRGQADAPQAGAQAAAPDSKRAGQPGKKRTTEVDRVIGAKLRLRRGELGITQTQLANAIGVTFQQVQKYEQGTNRIGGSRLAGIAKALEVPVSYFFEHSAEETEAAAASLLSQQGAIALLKAFASVKDLNQRQRVIDLVRALAGKGPLQDSQAAR